MIKDLDNQLFIKLTTANTYPTELFPPKSKMEVSDDTDDIQEELPTIPTKPKTKRLF